MIAVHRKSCDFYYESIPDAIFDEDNQLFSKPSKVFRLKLKPKPGLFDVLYERCKKGAAIGVRIFDEAYPNTESKPVKLSYEGEFIVVGCGQSYPEDSKEVELVCAGPITTSVRDW